MTQLERLPIALLGILLGACSTPGLELAPAASSEAWHPRVDARGEIVAGEASTTEAGRQSFVLPPNAAMGVTPAPAAIDTERVYTLAQLLDVAQENHPETRIAWAQARNAAIAARIAESAYLPHVSADIVGGHVASHGSSSGLGLQVAGDDAANGTISAVSLQWLLFDFGERSAVLDAARQVSVASNIAYTAAHQRVIHEVCMAYYALAAARAREDTARQSLKNAEDIEAAALARYKQGIGTVVETAQARQATAQARLQQVHAQGAAQDAYLNLMTAVGISPTSQVRLADIADRPLTPELAKTADLVVADALARRPDVLGAYALHKASLANVEAARAELMPKVFMAGTGSYTSGRLAATAIPSVGEQSPTLNLSGNHWGSTVMVGITIPLYDGRLRASMLKQAQIHVDSTSATLDKVRDDAVREVVSAQNGLRTSLAAHEAAVAFDDAAHTTLEASIDAYRHGVESVTDSTAAQSGWLQARDARTDAYYLVLEAAATLAFATGALGSAPEQP